MQLIAIIEYGMSNLFSVVNAVKKVKSNNTKIIITDKKQEIIKADKIIFPGQGAAKICMQNLNKKNLQKTIINCINNKQQKFFGICMGMQVLLSFSEENQGVRLINAISGKVVRIDNTTDTSKNIPHMGWNTITQKKHQLWHGIDNNSYFYFAHSYYCQLEDKKLILAHSKYCQDMVVAMGNDNFFAIQAHPEKSGNQGLQLIENFLKW